MTVTGLLHGSTLSFSRLGLVSYLTKRVSISEDKFTALSVNFIITAAGTMIGMMEDRHVFSSSLYTQTAADLAVGRLPQNPGDLLLLLLNPVKLVDLIQIVFKLGTQTYRPLDALVKDVLLRYDAKSAELKKDLFDQGSQIRHSRLGAVRPFPRWHRRQAAHDHHIHLNQASHAATAVEAALGERFGRGDGSCGGL